ncbi:MAG: RluA family pseudouridine synthase [Eubacteriales bacterium]|nr:RluA family pseudouridine synthase [Eubacteriales bacterium]MDD4582793.1 RluA family pseudouridine synthase [Eubacteriales bacterium]
MYEKTERFQYTITENDEEHSIKELLKSRLGISSRLLRKLKNENGVYLNRQPVKMNEKGNRGDQITLSMPIETSNFQPERIPIDVIYEDRDLLAINKQPGYVVHPTKGHPGHTLANGIMQYMLDRGDSYKIRFINRLDMDTSGVLLVGKNSYCQDHFFKQAEDGRVVKKYVALVHGSLERDEGVIDLPIGKPIDDQIRRTVMTEGDPSCTHYRVLERFKRSFSWVEITLETGRTHQIRVHMAHLGYPVVGDVLYGKPTVWLIERQALHAVQLDFDHPVSKQRLSLKAPIPQDIIELLNKIK